MWFLAYKIDVLYPRQPLLCDVLQSSNSCDICVAITPPRTVPALEEAVVAIVPYRTQLRQEYFNDIGSKVPVASIQRLLSHDSSRLSLLVLGRIAIGDLIPSDPVEINLPNLSVLRLEGEVGLDEVQNLGRVESLTLWDQGVPMLNLRKWLQANRTARRLWLRKVAEIGSAAEYNAPLPPVDGDPLSLDCLGMAGTLSRMLWVLYALDSHVRNLGTLVINIWDIFGDSERPSDWVVAPPMTSLKSLIAELRPTSLPQFLPFANGLKVKEATFSITSDDVVEMNNFRWRLDFIKFVFASDNDEPLLWPFGDSGRKSMIDLWIGSMLRMGTLRRVDLILDDSFDNDRHKIIPYVRESPATRLTLHTNLCPTVDVRRLDVIGCHFPHLQSLDLSQAAIRHSTDSPNNWENVWMNFHERVPKLEALALQIFTAESLKPCLQYGINLNVLKLVLTRHSPPNVFDLLGHTGEGWMPHLRVLQIKGRRGPGTKPYFQSLHTALHFRTTYGKKIEILGVLYGALAKEDLYSLSLLVETLEDGNVCEGIFVEPVRCLPSDHPLLPSW